MKTIELTEFFGKSALKLNVQIQNKKKFLLQISGSSDEIDFPQISTISSRKNELWTSGCFEIFVSNNYNDNSYTEYNFGFCTNWECFEFSDYRQNQVRPQINFSPKIICETENGNFIQIVKLQKDIISGNNFSLTCAIKLKDGSFLYFANKHCAKNPDFHQKSARCLKL